GKPIEQKRSKQNGCKSANHSAGGKPQIKGREISWWRTPARQLAMAHERADEEDGQMDCNQPDNVFDRFKNEDRNKPNHANWLYGDHQPVRHDWTACENDDEAQEIKRKRKDP